MKKGIQKIRRVLFILLVVTPMWEEGADARPPSRYGRDSRVTSRRRAIPRRPVVRRPPRILRRNQPVGNRRVRGRVGHRIPLRQIRSQRRFDRFAYETIRVARQELRCERMGDFLVGLSNRLNHQLEMAKRFPEFHYMKKREYWLDLWERIADVYSECDIGCFEDGEIIGEISAMGFCAASVELGGLTSVGAIDQPRMPLCETSIFVGCEQKYQQTAQSFPGCNHYSKEPIFQEYMSQDCHLSERF